MRRFGARWGGLLVGMSALGTAVLVGVGATGFITGLPTPASAGLAALCAVGLIGAMPFAVLGYGVDDDEIVVYHPGWKRSFRRDALVSAEHDPTAIRASIRTFGNGGLFSVSGWFANRALGAYRAYLTNTADTVVLRFRDGVVVVSPDAPRDFVAALDPTG